MYLPKFLLCHTESRASISCCIRELFKNYKTWKAVPYSARWVKSCISDYEQRKLMNQIFKSYKTILCVWSFSTRKIDLTLCADQNSKVYPGMIICNSCGYNKLIKYCQIFLDNYSMKNFYSKYIWKKKILFDTKNFIFEVQYLWCWRMLISSMLIKS
jgi:hypothetical protein